MCLSGQRYPFWVIRVAAVAGQNQDLSVVGPIATKLLQRSERSDVPLATNAPQHDRHKTKDRQRGGPSNSDWPG